MAIGFIVVTVSAPHAPGDPPAEGGFIVPLGAPLAVLGLAAAAVAAGIRRWRDDDERFKGIALAALGGALVFASVELVFGLRS
jgi:hypothetical protein